MGVAGSTKKPRWTGANGVDALPAPPPRPHFLSIARSCRPPGHQQHNTSHQHTKVMPSHAARRVKTHTGAHPADKHTHFTHGRKGHLQLHPSQKRYGQPPIFFSQPPSPHPHHHTGTFQRGPTCRWDTLRPNSFWPGTREETQVLFESFRAHGLAAELRPDILSAFLSFFRRSAASGSCEIE